MSGLIPPCRVCGCIANDDNDCYRVQPDLCSRCSCLTPDEFERLDAAYFGTDNAFVDVVQTVERIVADRVKAARDEVETWKETAVKFSDDYHAELVRRIDAETATRAARDEALAPVLALADGWDVTSRMTPDVRALLTDLRAVVERAVEPTP